MLCDNCQTQEATIHVNETDGDVVTHRDLCDACFEASNAAAGHDLATAWQSGCRFCGGEAYVGGGHSLTPGISFMCKPCAEEYFRFLREMWPGFGDVEITDIQIANIHRTDKAAVFRQAEEHMKKWVAERKPK